MDIYTISRFILSTTYATLIGTPSRSYWAMFLVWAVRLATLSFLLRNIVLPWSLRQLSKYLNIKSISLRSIRGLRVQGGPFTGRIERISYAFVAPFGIAIKVEGLEVEIDRSKALEAVLTSKPGRLRSMFPSLAAAEKLFWELISTIHKVADPIMRPKIRSTVLYFLRLGVRYLPYISHALSFDIFPMKIVFKGATTSPHHAELVFTKVHATASLDLESIPNAMSGPNESQEPHPSSHGFKAMRTKMRGAWKRSLDRALDMMKGSTQLSLTFENATGRIVNLDEATTFVTLPGVIAISARAAFDPKAGRVDPNSVETELVIDEFTVEASGLKTLLEILKTPPKPMPVVIERKTARSPPLPFASLDPTLLSPPGSPGSTTAPFRSFSPSFFRSPPGSPALSPGKRPLSAFMPHSPLSPASPFNDVFAIFPIRSKHKPVSRLKNVRNTSMMWFLKSFTVRLKEVTLVDEVANEKHVIAIQDIKLSCTLSSADSNALHRSHLGKTTGSRLDPDVYAFNFSVVETSLRRTMYQSDMRLLWIGEIRCNVLATQCLPPFLTPLAFMSGDPNTSLVVAQIAIEGVELTEHEEFLSKWVSRLPEPKPKITVETLPDISAELADENMTGPSLPRFHVSIECGTIVSRLLQGPYGQALRALEVRSDGFSAAAHTMFRTNHPHRDSGANFTPYPEVDGAPVLMALNANSSFHPASIRVRQASPSDLLGDNFSQSPALFSVGTIEIRAHGTVVGKSREDSQVLPELDMATLMTQVHVSSEIICLELWNPNVIDVVGQVLHAIPNPPPRTPITPKRPLLNRLPRGLSVTASLGRATIVITSPDINPNDAADLSRGVSLTVSGFVAQYSYQRVTVRSKALADKAQIRHILRLPDELIMDALSAAKAAESRQASSALMRLNISRLSLRSVTASPDTIDDSMTLGMGRSLNSEEEFMAVTNFGANAELTAHRDRQEYSRDSVIVKCLCPAIESSLRLSHIYHVMLARQTLHALNPGRSNSTPTYPREPSTSHIDLSLNFSIKTLQVRVKLPRTQVALRLDDFNVKLDFDRSVIVKWRRLLSWVPAPRRGHKRETGWQEILSLQRWTVTPMPKDPTGPSVSIEGDSGHIHIPFGYILSELIQDIGVTVKAVKHLSKVTFAGQYYAMSPPEAEGPKHIPNISIRVARLVAEAADDVLESRLGLIWRTGLEASKSRLEREMAFDAKVTAISSGKSSASPTMMGKEYDFDARHSVSIADARHRLDNVHFVDWMLRMKRSTQEQQYADNMAAHRPNVPSSTKDKVPNIVDVTPTPDCPPLFRIALMGLTLGLSEPSFPITSLPEFLQEQGGLPATTKFSLLVPLRLSLGISSLRVALRDYPIPLVDIPPHIDRTITTLEFDTDLVIGEEMGTAASVEWVNCPIVGSEHEASGIQSFSVMVPKTIMPVKTYANPEIKVSTPQPTTFSWSVSYAPAMQDVMRVVDTISSAPKDSSPGIGFWDKLRLICHWTVKATFTGEVRFFMKGLRDPHITTGAGAGFVLAWKGSPQLLLGRPNDEKELIQLTSHSMIIAVPNLDALSRINGSCPAYLPALISFKKVVAKLRSGIRFGVGIALERACGPECTACQGDAFHRKCRYFDFKPHHSIKLEKKASKPISGAPDDSYAGFRSDFIHMSVSLSASSSGTASRAPSTVHLTPKLFAHFYSWVSLFEGVMSLPVRQGSYWPQRALSPKFGRHIATLKYRVSIHRILVMHGYMDDARSTWKDGVTPWIGVKGMVHELQLDVHQRDQETVKINGSQKPTRHKALYAAELVLKGLDLRSMLANFADTSKKSIFDKTDLEDQSNYSKRKDLPLTLPDSLWYDTDDFVELDWKGTVNPTVHVLPAVSCPRFTYFRRDQTELSSSTEYSKFGAEGTHRCVLGTEPSVYKVQAALARTRISDLKLRAGEDWPKHARTRKTISELEEYIGQLEAGFDLDPSATHHHQNMPYNAVSPDEWAEFDNVYQIHSPKIFLDGPVRDIMMQYYYSSRARRGFEYHMSTRAIKFLLDQAKAALVPNPRLSSEIQDDSPTSKPQNITAAHAAALAIRKILIKDEARPSKEELVEDDESVIDPLHGWSEGVSLQKSHCCLLLKPQIVLQVEGEQGETCVVAAIQAKLQTFAVMDNANVDDPITGKVMSRTYTQLSGLQTFAPTKLHQGEVCVPVEVIADLRCENQEFDRLVPQTDATFRYDKFNRLRLRNNLTSVAARVSTDSVGHGINHLQDETDLIEVKIPRFTMTANDHHFQTISNIVTRLLLFSDAIHKTRLERLETLLFAYDFTDLNSASVVIRDVQSRLRAATEAVQVAELNPEPMTSQFETELLHLKAHIFLLTEELNLLFDAIKLAQDRASQDGVEHKSALLLNASSREISWKMLDDNKELLAKLAVQHIDFYWLSRQDSSTLNKLTVGNLVAFDGSPDAQWTEILSKYDDTGHHPLTKKNLFLLASWCILPPVGGISIYESFELIFHPMRLQIDGRIGTRIMDYMWPARRQRKALERQQQAVMNAAATGAFKRASVDSPTRDVHGPTLSPPGLRRLGVSRSFTDLRSASAHAALKVHNTFDMIHSSKSSENLAQVDDEGTSDARKHKLKTAKLPGPGDAAEMKYRSGARTFIYVKISSLNLMLSVSKEDAFVCRDAHIKTRDLEYRNQTWSFEELAGQFMLSNKGGWMGWVKMAFNQPLIPVLPVARELISKTKWFRAIAPGDESLSSRTPSPSKGWRKPRRPQTPTSLSIEPASVAQNGEEEGAGVTEFGERDMTVTPTRPGRKRVKSLFSRNSSRSRTRKGKTPTPAEPVPDVPSNVP